MKPSDPQYNFCLAALKQSPFYASLSDEVQRDILTLFRYERVRKQDTSSILDGMGQNFYLIVQGRIKVAANHPETGRKHILYVLGPGDGFDLISLLDGKRHDVIATALDDVGILVTPLTQAREWLYEHPNFNLSFLPYIGEQMRQLTEQVVDISLYDTETRLAHLILRHLTSNSPVHGLRLINDLSQEALAGIIGSSRVVVANHIKHWKKQGILSGERGHWSVDDLQKLLEKAERQFDISPDEQ